MALTDTPSKTRTITLSDEVYDGIIAVLQGNKKIVGRNANLTPQQRAIRDKSDNYYLSSGYEQLLICSAIVLFNT